jgi:hypothetical protein
MPWRASETSSLIKKEEKKMVRVSELVYRIVNFGLGAKPPATQNTTRGFFGFFSCLLVLGLTFGLAGSAAAQKGKKIITSPSGASLEISEWDDGAQRSKYLVRSAKNPESSRQYWYSMTGSANSGPNEAGRRTTRQEWCRVRYLYGDNVRIPECDTEFMYSSHLITGVDGMHYELWFRPSSLSYYKIRNQETGVWYAHDGSANDGRVRTTKEDWCRVIFYHMSGILKSPNECQEFNKKFTSAIAGLSGPGAQRAELSYVSAFMGTDAGEIASMSVGGVTGAALEEGFAKMAEGAIGNMDYKTGSGIFKNVGTGAKAMLKEAGAGLIVGAAVDYGVGKLKERFGWQAKDANAGMIAAEVATTTIASTAITTAIMTVAGASFNPVVAGVGLLIAGGIAAGEEIAKASKDTGITFERGYTSQPRYNRDLNGIGPEVFAQNNPPGTFEWEECATENGQCKFEGIRSVRYGAGDKFEERAFLNSVDCNNTTFGDPAPGVAKTCVLQTLPVDRFYLVKQSNNPAIYIQKRARKKDGTTKESYCILQNMGAVNAYGFAYREVPALSLKGTDEGMCAVPNGFYKLDKTPTIWYAYGDVTPLSSGKVLGNKFCSIPSMQILTALGGAGAFMTLPAGSDITRHRKDEGVCDLKNFTEPQVLDWEECAKENERCVFEGTRTVRYGTGNSFVELAFENGVDCNNATFGDPASSINKVCYVKIPDGNPDLKDCAKENGRCEFDGVRIVRYGAGDNFVQRTFFNGVDCNTATFGRDPAPNVAKTCQVEKRKPTGNYDWDDCAKENEKCAFYGIRLVRYGAGDKFVEKGFFNGVDCNTAAFGTDPAPNVAKTCVVQTYPMDRYYMVKKSGEDTIYFQQGKEQYCAMPNMTVFQAYGATFKEVPTLNLMGRNSGACMLPDGFYKIGTNPTIWRLYGEGVKLGNGKVIGNKFCAVPNMDVLNKLGGTAFTTLPEGFIVTPYRTDMKVCAAP